MNDNPLNSAFSISAYVTTSCASTLTIHSEGKHGESR